MALAQRDFESMAKYLPELEGKICSLRCYWGSAKAVDLVIRYRIALLSQVSKIAKKNRSTGVEYLDWWAQCQVVENKPRLTILHSLLEVNQEKVPDRRVGFSKDVIIRFLRNEIFQSPTS